MNASTRVGVAAAAGVLAALATGFGGSWDFAASIGWDAAAVVFLIGTWSAIGGMDAAATATHATREDPTRQVRRVIVLTATVASLVGVGYLLVQAGSDQGLTRALVAALGLGGLAISWLVVHTVFMLNYASLYYGDSPNGGSAPKYDGVDFGRTTPPRYSDFAYLAFTIGMTFQVSDTELTTIVMRNAVLRHALLSYVFGSLILAGSVNLVVSLTTSGS